MKKTKPLTTDQKSERVRHGVGNRHAGKIAGCFSHSQRSNGASGRAESEGAVAGTAGLVKIGQRSAAVLLRGGAVSTSYSFWPTLLLKVTRLRFRLVAHRFKTA